MLVIPQRRRDLGGFEVGRLLPYHARRMVGPFIFLDHMGPADFPASLAKSADVRAHPHIGLATVTFLFEGEIMHRDSVGSEQAIRPGELNWMVAGAGITHSERFERARAEGGRLNGVQAWIALPEEVEEIAPSFAHFSGNDALPLYEQDGFRARLILGSGFGAKAAAPVHSPLFYAHWELAAGRRAGLPAEYSERAAFIASGEVEIDHQTHGGGTMLVFEPGQTIVFSALSDAVIMLLGGEPVGERFIEWNFVSSRRERIEVAKADWKAGRMKLPDLDAQEFIAAPAEWG